MEEFLLAVGLIVTNWGKVTTVFTICFGIGLFAGTAFPADLAHQCASQGTHYQCVVPPPSNDVPTLAKVNRLLLSFPDRGVTYVSNNLGWNCTRPNTRFVVCTKGAQALGLAGIQVVVDSDGVPEYRNDGWFKPDKTQPARGKRDPVVSHSLCDTDSCVYSLPLNGTATHSWIANIEEGQPLGVYAVFYGPGWQVASATEIGGSLPNGTIVGTSQGTADAFCDGVIDSLVDPVTGLPESLVAKSLNLPLSLDVLGRPETYLDAAMPPYPRVARYRADSDGARLGGTLPFMFDEPRSVNTFVMHPPWAPTGSTVVMSTPFNPSPPTRQLECIDAPASEAWTLTGQAIQGPTTPGYHIVWFVYGSDVTPFPNALGEVANLDLGFYCYYMSGTGASPPPSGSTADNDEDCLPQSSDPGTDDTISDRDGDGLVDGIEVAWGSNPDAADTDGDGLDDYKEMMLLSDPTSSDTDGDTVPDATDNCPSVFNLSQSNADGDPFGDACDVDDDNDGLSDFTEGVPGAIFFDMTPMPRCTPTNDGDASDIGLLLSSLNSDDDGDGYLSGAECMMGSNPASAASRPAPAAIGDADGDGLNIAQERAFRSAGFSGPMLDVTPGNEDFDGDGLGGLDDRDSDSDGLADGCEALVTGTKLWRADSDYDGTPDALEAGVWGPVYSLDNGPSVAGDDLTNPRFDSPFHCTTDGDGDGRLDSDERSGTGCGGAVTLVNSDASYGVITGATGANSTSFDSDGDTVPDGVECTVGTNPLANSASDRTACSIFFGSSDADGDGLSAAVERCKWNTNPAVSNTDGDGLGDCTEAYDVNGNGQRNTADATLVLRAFFLLDIGDLAAEDVNGNGAVNTADATLIKRAFFGIDPCI